MNPWMTDVLFPVIRNLADINNRGKLNLPEFHVAMGLIYRGGPPDLSRHSRF